MDEFDEEFGDDLDDEEMILAATQVEQQRRDDQIPQASVLPPPHTNKRRRLNHLDDHSVEEKGADDDDSDAFGPAPHPVRWASSGSARSVIRHETSLSPGEDGVPHRTISSRGRGFGAPQPGQKRDLTPDLSTELENLPSDAFASSPLNESREEKLVYISSSQPFSSQQHRYVSTSRGGYRQTTLFGGRAQDSDPLPLTNRRRNRNRPFVNSQEPPTHHKLDRKAMETWVFPTNLGNIRDYQFNIVQKGLFHNLLVALPTGLGKTFIAATIMLNWFRWTTESQIIFVAPTRPLVAQQVDACFGIVGIPRSQTAMLTGGISPGHRAEEWNSKRAIFLTPQTLINDLKTGICDPKKIVCLVVDEAHRATGGYAYVEVVKFIRRFNQSFRILALTATPGAAVEKVQEVIDGLDLARVEIRTEESLDIRSYVHRRKVELIPLDPSKDLTMLMDLYAKALQPLLNKLIQHNAYWARDPRSLTAFGLLEARKKWLTSGAGRSASMATKGMMHALFSLLCQLAHPIGLLQFHGIGPFYRNLMGFRAEVENQGKKAGKTRKQVVENPDFRELMSKAQRLVNDPAYMGHPKLEYLVGVVLRHFADSGNGRNASGAVPPSETRVMIFVHFRDSAEEVVRVLKRHEPMVRPTIFNGQSTSKGGSVGMSQKDQLEAISKFHKGVFNTIVATSIGEEGLDIGEIDLIVCYDSSSSPVRMLQRMGRTGRKRDGNIVLLLMRGKEIDSYAKANECYEKMQEMIAKGDRFSYHEEVSRRIVPRDIQPVADKRTIEIPLENSQPERAEPEKRRGKPPKRPPKRFFMPDGVETGFVKASHLPGRGGNSENGVSQASNVAEEELDDVPSDQDVLLNSQDQREHDRTYTHAFGGILDIGHIELCAWPANQRSLGRTKYVEHGQKTVRMVKMLAEMHEINDAKLACLEMNLHPEDLEEALEVPISGGDVGSQKRKQSTTRPPLDRPHFQSVDTDSSMGIDGDGDMGSFIVDDDESVDDAVTDRSLTFSPPPLEVLRKPFYSPLERKQYLDSGSEDELPDVSALVRKEPKMSRDVLAEKISAENLPQPRPRSQRKGKRAVIEDSDDDG
ncbi:MAG: 3'-5' DNA helicase [Geoglossum simile]|nr:MAG: 3'-5' DNA helicase [Geoglossum simile]